MSSRNTLGLLAAILLCPASDPAWAGNATLRLEVQGKTIEGTPLHWANNRLQLLGRDGYLRELSISSPKSAVKTSDSFTPFSQSEMRGKLLREFGKGYQVSGTGHYLVIHPEGERDVWAPRFEEIYRSFTRYFSVRGVALKPILFPLVAIVLPNRDEFERYTRREGSRLGPGYLGYYSTISNRIVVYDTTAGSKNSDWSLNADTIVHEVAHQIAFNTGLHHRFAERPVWVVEGLGTVFEARGVWNSAYHTRPSDRINQGRLAQFREYAATTRKKGSLAEFLSSDRPFRANEDVGYAQAWAFTHFLMENYPRKYLEYLTKTAARPNSSRYPDQDRLKDFTDVFGKDLGSMETRFLRFVSNLK